MISWIKSLWRKITPKNTGDYGEELAARFLEDRAKLRVVVRNWRNPRDRRDEIDLIALDGDVMVFVEVKARAITAKVPGYYAVDQRKKRVVQRAARAYITGLAHKPRTVRFDVVEVALPGKSDDDEPVVRHFANVPLFPKDFRPDRW